MEQRRGTRGVSVLLSALLFAAALGGCGSTEEKKKPATGVVLSAATSTAGMSACVGCHSEVASAWLASRHANLDATGELSSEGSPTTGKTCAKTCHDPTGDSSQVAVVPSLGTTARPVIGCEACHGPGSVHVAAGGTGPISLQANTTGGTLGTTAVSPQFKMCTACHVLLDQAGLAASGTSTPRVQHSTLSDRVITDTHYATPNSWSATTGRNDVPAKAVTGYAMAYNEDKVCSECHNPHRTADINRDWAASAHADTYGSNTSDPLGFFSGAWSYYNWSCDGATASNCGTSSRTACQRCHTTSGFKQYADALAKKDAAAAESIRKGLVSSLTPTSGYKPEMLKCSGCHRDNKGTLRNPGPISANYDYTTGNPAITYSVASYEYPDVSSSNICMACHTGRESGDTVKNLNASGMPAANLNNFSFINSHYLAGGGTVFTATGYEFGGRSYQNPSSYRHSRIGTVAENNTGLGGPCVGCHMSRPGGSGDHLFLPVGRDANGITGIASEVCFVCHIMPNNVLSESTNERREEFREALEALKRELDKQGFYFEPSSPYFFNAVTSLGKVSLVNGLTTVTGTGTTWSTAGIVTGTSGDVFRSYDGSYYTIAAVNSDTSLTLSSAYTGPSTAGPVPYGIVRKSSTTYTKGTVAVAQGSPIVTGTGTGWTTAGIATGPTGSAFRDKNGVFYSIASVDSDTQLTLAVNYAGSSASAQSYALVKNTGHKTGLVTLTTGSTIVTGAGTSWKSAGIVTGSSGDPFLDNGGNYYAIQSIDSDSQLTLSSAYAGATAAGQPYTIMRYGPANSMKDWDPANAGGTNGGTLAKSNMGAAFNFNVLEHDPGAYIHNSYYTRRLIYDSIDWLDDKAMNFSVGKTLNDLTTEPYKASAMKYLLPGGVTGSAGERP